MTTEFRKMISKTTPVDLIKTIDDDEEVEDFSEDSDEEVEVSLINIYLLSNNE